jgi:hypothetical protein
VAFPHRRISHDTLLYRYCLSLLMCRPLENPNATLDTLASPADDMHYP